MSAIKEITIASLSEFPYIYPEAGTFAGFTLEKRFPKILQDVLNNPHLTEPSNNAIQGLHDELSTVRVRRLQLIPEEEPYWADFFSAYLGKPFVEVPFFFLEIYFYRLINEIIAANQPFTDPFLHIKNQDITSNNPFFHDVIQRLDTLDVSQCLQLSVEGNRSDLSQFEQNKKAKGLEYLIDDSASFTDGLPMDNLHILCDNSGVELFTDLVLAMKLLSSCKTITLHLKELSLLVSDATRQDLAQLLDYLRSIGDDHFVDQVDSKIREEKLKVESDYFWNAPVFYDHLPITNDPKDVLISKGDANYRRFFHDKKFPAHLTVELNSIGFGEVFALRTLKSEIQTGLDPNKVSVLHQQDPDWMSGGQYAVIQKLK